MALAEFVATVEQAGHTRLAYCAHELGTGKVTAQRADDCIPTASTYTNCGPVALFER